MLFIPGAVPTDPLVPLHDGGRAEPEDGTNPHAAPPRQPHHEANIHPRCIAMPGVCCVKSYVSNELTFTNRKRTDLLVNVGTFRNVTFYTADPSTTFRTRI